jgi:hypothetical protein
VSRPFPRTSTSSEIQERATPHPPALQRDLRLAPRAASSPSSRRNAIA